MRVGVELWAFRTVVGLVLIIPLVAGLAGAFGGLEALAAVLGADPHVVVGPSLRNSLRAICWMFFALVPMVVWTLRSMHERRGGFRVIVVCACLAGLARLTSYLVDGPPGVVPVVLMVLELGLMPVLLLWHARLLRLVVGP
jgi:hypothetical protein